MRIPSLVRQRQFRILVRLSDRRRHRVEAPFERAALQIVGRDITAHGGVPHVGAAVADDHDVAGNLRCAGAGVGQLVIRDGVGFPNFLAGRGVQCVQTSIGGGDIDLTLPHRHPAVDQVAAGVSAGEIVGLRVVAPQLPARGGIDRVDIAPGSGGVHHTVDDDRASLPGRASEGLSRTARQSPAARCSSRRCGSRANSSCHPCRARW